MGFLAEPQKSLVPIGGNFFATPNTPADPRDCDRFPNSPWCGRGFLDRRALAIDPQLISDHCNLGVSFSGTLAFIRLPTVQIVYRNPACQPPPAPPPQFPPVADNKCARLVCDDGSVITTVIYKEEAQPGNYSHYPIPVFPKDTDAQKVCNARYEAALASSKEIINHLPKFIKNAKLTMASLSHGWYAQQESLPRFRIARTINGITYPANDTFTTKDSPPTRLSIYEGNIECNDYCFYVEYDYPTGYADESTPYFGDYYHANVQSEIWTITRFKVPLCTIVPEPPPPPKPPEIMPCCNDALSKLILKRIGNLPVDVPKSYLTKNGVQPTQVKKIESLTEFIAWFAERHDETLGEFEITIEVDDADLTKQGKQKQTIRLPNLAEAIAEMCSLLIHANINNELILNIVNRTLIESGQIKQSDFKIHSALHALIDYIGFHTNSESQKMPLSFTAGEKSFDKFLKESQQDVSVITYHQKETLTAIMQPLLQAAAITRAVHYRGIHGNKQQIASALKKDLTSLLGEKGDLSEHIKDFITKVEKVYNDVDNKPNK